MSMNGTQPHVHVRWALSGLPRDMVQKMTAYPGFLSALAPSHSCIVDVDDLQS